MLTAGLSLQPMTSLQRSMVLASLGAPNEGVYVVQDVCDLAGEFDLSLLREAWQAVASRYPALCRAVRIQEGEPIGLSPDEEGDARWQVEDYSELPEEERSNWLEQFLLDDRRQGFDFESGVPLRITVIRNSPQSITIVWTVHHVLLDGRSMTLVWSEWLACYDALVRGEGVPAFEEHADSVVPSAEGEEFWRDYLQGLSQTTDYIVDRMRSVAPAVSEPVGRVRVELDRDVARRLRQVAEIHDVSLNNVVQGAWAVLLGRCGGRSDVVFGVTRSGRTAAPEDSRKVGFHINTLPLRVKVDPEASLGSWLGVVRRRWLALREVEQTSLQQAVRWGGLPAGLPPFECLMNYDHEPPIETLRRLGGHWSTASLHRLQRTDSPLILAAYGSPLLSLELIFDTSRFSTRTMSAALGHLEELLRSFVSHPDARLRELNMLGAEERRLFLDGHDRLQVPSVCIHEVFERQVEQSPSATAIDTGSGCISYRDLNERANRLAWRLHGSGVGPGDLVAVCMPPSPESVIAVLAVLKAGAAFLPLDPEVPELRLKAAVADAGSRIVLCSRDAEATARALGNEVLKVGPWYEERTDALCTNLPNAATPEDLAYLVHTSGSTGRPKAVAVPHRALVNHSLAASSIYGISTTDRRLQMASVGTDVFVAEVFNYLCRGAALVFGWNRRSRSVREFLTFLGEQKITITGVPSAWWNEWMAAVEESGAPPPPCLRAVIIGMEKADPATFAKWKRVAGQTRLFNAYGPAETSPTTTIYETGSSKWECGAYVPIGKPLGNTSVYVLDENRSPVPAGVAGELYIGGAGLARGYWNRPELTAERFVPSPFDSDPSSRLYRTGDIGFYLPDGNLVFVGRADRQVKIRGFRVELDEIETVLAGCDGVRQCAVVLAQEGERPFLAAFVAFHADSSGPEAVRSYLTQRMPEHMIPAAVVTVAELPVTPGGKIDREALPMWKVERVRPENGFEPLSTETEKRLAEVWRQILHVWPIGATDSFFALGADSLDATQLVTQVEKQFGLEVPASLFVRVPTLARMAFVIESRKIPVAREEKSGAVVPLQPHGSRIPFFCFPGNDSPEFFLPLAASLGNEQPFLAVRDPRPYREREPYTVEQAAERLLGAVRQVQPRGPYVLGGHCFGGFVAFEAARQLSAAGETVAKLILIEVGAPGYPKVVRNWRNYTRVASKVLRGERRLSLAEVQSHFGVLAELIRNRVTSWTRRTVRDTLLSPRLEETAAPLHPNARAGRNYDPKPFACDLVQFIAAGERHTTEILDDPRLGWRDLAKAKFTVESVEGASDALYRPPYVAGLAARINSVLDGVNERHERSPRLR